MPPRHDPLEHSERCGQRRCKFCGGDRSSRQYLKVVFGRSIWDPCCICFSAHRGPRGKVFLNNCNRIPPISDTPSNFRTSSAGTIATGGSYLIIFSVCVSTPVCRFSPNVGFVCGEIWLLCGSCPLGDHLGYLQGQQISQADVGNVDF